MKIKDDKNNRNEIKTAVYVAREYGSLAGAGGIKDVAEGLCKAAAAAGIETHMFIPFYQVIRAKNDLNPVKVCAFDMPLNYAREKRTESVTIYDLQQAGVKIHLIQAGLYDYLTEGNNIPRKGIYQYTREEAEALGRPELTDTGYYSFFAMNVLLVKATLYAIGKMGIRPDIIHCHDGHAALLPLIAQTSNEGWVPPFLRSVPSVITVHNAGKGYHQDVEDMVFASAICGVPRDVVDGCLLNGSFDPLLAGGLFGSVINTVSENYARELQHTGRDWMTGWFGHTLTRYGIKLSGVTNGVDPETFNPQNPGQLGLAASFSPVSGDLRGKEVCKQETLELFGRHEIPGNIKLYGNIEYRKSTPLLTFIGRLDYQKGYDVLTGAIDALFNKDQEVQLLGLGAGSLWIEQRFRDLAARFDKRICIAVGFSATLANKIYAAGDFFLIPSHYEPCGLTDFYAQLMGNVPVVHRVGGLVKTIDGEYGFSYSGGARELCATVQRALEVYRQPKKTALRKIRKDAVKNIYNHFTWEKVLEEKYLPLYHEALERSKPALPYL